MKNLILGIFSLVSWLLLTYDVCLRVFRTMFGWNQQKKTTTILLCNCNSKPCSCQNTTLLTILPTHVTTRPGLNNMKTLTEAIQLHCALVWICQSKVCPELRKLILRVFYNFQGVTKQLCLLKMDTQAYWDKPSTFTNKPYGNMVLLTKSIINCIYKQTLLEDYLIHNSVLYCILQVAHAQQIHKHTQIFVYT